MTVITVWVLVIAGHSTTPKYYGNIDNIATKEECIRLMDVMEKRTRHQGAFCMEAKKVKP
jgi:hypothetical protein